MNRRTFIASLIGIPAALKALVTAKPAIVPYDPAKLMAMPGYRGPGRIVMCSTPNGPMSDMERMWMNNREQHLWATHCHSPAYEKALQDIADRNPGCFERLREQFYGTHRPQPR